MPRFLVCAPGMSKTIDGESPTVEHTADDVYCMVGAFKFLVDLDCFHPNSNISLDIFATDLRKSLLSFAESAPNRFPARNC